MNKIALDTNVIIYAFIESAQYHGQVKAELQNLYKNKTPLYITHQNILESERVLEKVYKIPRKQAMKDVNHFIRVFRVRVFSPLATTLMRYRTIVSTSGTAVFDSYLAATLLDHGISCLYTFNEKDFSGIQDFTATRNP